MEVTRLVFLAVNHGVFHLTWKSFALISHGGLIFDTSAILYVNCLWLALAFFPLHYKERSGFRQLEKIVYVVTNSIALAANLCDTVFFGFRQHRSTMALFDEFGNEGVASLLRIISTEALSHWYLVVLFAAIVWFLWHFYRPTYPPCQDKPLWHYYLGHTVGLGLCVAIFIWGVRGCTFSSVTRPISVGYAQRFATEPIDVDLVLNTPFAMLRTIGGSPDPVPDFFSDEELQEIYSPIHTPADSVGGELRGHNVVILVLESFSREFIGALNPWEGYTPFLDSLLSKSLRFEQTYSNSGFSIDALPSLLASTPRMRRPFIVSPYSLNHVTGLGELLDAEGYHTAFFHGADNESLGLQAFVRQAGFKHYYGINEYVADPQTGGMDDFDGTWGIWDEPMLQYFRRKISEMPQPFATGLFTLSSHHPFDIPRELQDSFPPEGNLEIYRTVRYADYALRKFFEAAEREPWFGNTLFVISADHTFLHEPEHPEYNTEYGRQRIPIVLYDPSGTLGSGVRPGSMQQIDVLPTVLGLLGYDKPYFAFGQDVMHTPADSIWAVRWNHFPQLVWGDYVLQMEPTNWQPTGFFRISDDPLQQHNLLGTGIEQEEAMIRKLKAIVQSYIKYQSANKVAL
ncbi:MAG: LTA synthase family protein [Bacteroides sp.]|nr:LTA synthase family protein [Bacteroides sp.]MCM1446571.1 LTA synthase family protein [Prevotella sp.]